MPSKKSPSTNAKSNGSSGDGHDDENVIQPFKQNFHILDEVVGLSQAESSSAEAHEPVVTAIPESKLPPQGAATSTPPNYDQSYTQKRQPVNPPPPAAATPTPGPAPAPTGTGESNFWHDLGKTAARATVWCIVWGVFGAVFDTNEITDA